MNKLLKSGSQCLVEIEHIIQAYERQDLIEGNQSVGRFSRTVMDWYSCYMHVAEDLADGGFVDGGRVQNVMETMLSAMENRDYILLSDLMELSLKPLLYDVQGAILAMTGCECGYSGYDINVNILREYAPEVLKQLSIYDMTDTEVHREVLYHKLVQSYVQTGRIEPSSSGYPTFAYEDNDKRYYAHSNVNPVVQAGRLAESYYDIQHDTYLVFGLGLGYLPDALMHLDDGITLTVYEMDRDVILMALLAGQLAWLQHRRVTLVYDPEGEELRQFVSEQIVPILYRPAVEHIRSEELHETILQLSMRDINVRHYQRIFRMNARENLRNCTEPVDVIRDRFDGRNAVIVAAGPSLSKNIEQLRNVPENTLIIAVGTVLKRLLGCGIRPDYVVFLDQNPSLYQQIEGIEYETVPALIAGTAYRRIAQAYQGPKYLVCQRDNAYTEAVQKKYGAVQFVSGGNVTTLALEICLQLGCREIALIGYDMAYTDGHSHDEGIGKQRMTAQDDLIRVEGVNGDTVYTNRVFYGYKKWVERRVDGLPPYKVIDATEGGARKEGMQIMSLQDVFKRWNTFRKG